MAARPEIHRSRLGTKTASVSMDAAAALALTTQDLNTAMVTFDRWASQNPEKLDANNLEFKAMKQTVKKLRLRIKEQKELHDNYRTMFAVFPGLLSVSNEPDGDDTGKMFTRSRNTSVLQARQGMRVGARPQNKLSKG